MGRVAKDTFLRVANVVHRELFKATDGRLGGSLVGMPALILTTVGRKSGQRRNTMLTAPIMEGDLIVLVASYGGDDRHPAWFLNLRANPNVEVTMRGTTKPMHARIATSDEKNEMWPRITSAYRGYAGYQKRTARDIPIVILEPKTEGAT